jgi:hypothetical protein
MSLQCAFVPQVPFASYKEFEEMLESLISGYECMVLQSFNTCNVVRWCQFHEGLSAGCKGHWEEHGHVLFMQFTKGLGSDWCETVNTMVVHALNAAVRATIKTRKLMGAPMDGGLNDQALLRELIKNETRYAIADRECCPHNMYLFEIRNFQDMCSPDDWYNVDFVPIAQLQALQLAFCMLGHGRLGGGGAGRGLSGDVIKLILMKMLE